MRKIFFITTLILTSLTTACSSKPIGYMTVYTSTVHIDGNDVLFEHNGTYYKAKGQKDIFEKNKQNVVSMTIIALDDGNYIIQNNNTIANTITQTSPSLNTDINEISVESEIERQRRLEEEKTEFRRNIIEREKKIEELKVQMRQDKQDAQLEMQMKALEAQINSLKEKYEDK